MRVSYALLRLSLPSFDIASNLFPWAAMVTVACDYTDNMPACRLIGK